MLGFANLAEKRQAKAKAAQAREALNEARALPLTMQQDIARQVMRECTDTMGLMATAAKAGREQYAFYALHTAELQQRIDHATLLADSDGMDRRIMALRMAQSILQASSGASEAYEKLAADILQWAQTILPDFSRYQAKLLH
ncbi:MAG: hypothetical protein JSR81_02240 [Proteobacteria bacterium]|nr:hypothetical protein [Pseudomonadota bacterium]